MTTLTLKLGDKKLLILTLVISFLMTIFALSPDIWDRYRVVIDVQNSYWMARYQDPNLFPRDYLLGRQLIEITLLGRPIPLYPLSLGWGLLFYPMSFLIDYVWLTKWLVFIIIPICIVYLFKLGQFIEGNLTGLSLSLLFTFFILASPQSISPASGLQRGFAVPLLIIFLYYLLKKQYFGAGLMIFVSTLVYVPNFFLTSLTYALALMQLEPPFKVSLNLTPSKVLPLIGGIFLSGLLIILTLAVEYQWIASAATAVGEGGSATDPLYLSFPWLGRAGVFDTGADVINFLVMLAFGFLIYKIVGPSSLKRLPSAWWYLLVASVIMFVLALFFILQPWISFSLYYPSRYTRSSLFVLAFFFLGLNWTDFLDKAPTWFRRRAPLIIFFVMSLILVLAIIYFFAPGQLPIIPLLLFIGLLAAGVFVLLGGGSLLWLMGYPTFTTARDNIAALLIVGVLVISIGGVYIKTLGLKMPDPSSDARELYEFVATLPPEVLLAGDAQVMNDIPLFAKRGVLFNELAGSSAAAILDFFDAYYAESGAVILNFCQRYNVDYLVLNDKLFTPEYLTAGEFYHPPYNDQIVKMVAGRSDFVMLDLQPIFTRGPYRLIACDEAILLANH